MQILLFDRNYYYNYIGCMKSYAYSGIAVWIILGGSLLQKILRWNYFKTILIHLKYLYI